MTDNLWAHILERLRTEIDAEDLRRWFSQTTFASDVGDQITIWVPTEAIRRHISTHFREHLDHALDALDRSDTHIRFIVTGYGDEDDDE